MADKKNKKSPKVEKVEKVEKKEEVVVETKSDHELTEKELRKKYGGKSTFSKVMNVILWIVLLLWMAIVLIDFYNVNKKNDPLFCLDKGTTEYKDGNVEWCLGAGYKIYRYKRDCYTAIEFGPFWSKDRSLAEKECPNK